MARSGPLTRDTSTVALGLAQIRVGSAAANIATVAPVLTSSNSIGALGETTYTGNTEFWKLESGFPALEDMTLPIRESSQLSVTYKEITPFNLALARGIDPLGDISAGVVEGTIVSTLGTTTGAITVVNTPDHVVTDTFTVVFSGAEAGDIYGETSGLVHTFSALDSAMSPVHDTDEVYFTIPSGFFSGTWADGDVFTFRTTAFVAGTAAYSDAHSGEIKLGGLTAPAYLRMEADYTYPNGTNHMYVIFPRANVTGSMEIAFQAEDAAAPPMVFEAKRADSATSGGNAAWDAMPLGRIFFS